MESILFDSIELESGLAMDTNRNNNGFLTFSQRVTDGIFVPNDIYLPLMVKTNKAQKATVSIIIWIVDIEYR